MPMIPEEVENILKAYVYLYIDPNNGEVFYIGKGKGSRMLHHLDDIGDTEKAERIENIRKNGKEPIIEILRYGLTDSEARLVEAAAIDLVGKKNLTNRISGCHSGSSGRILLSDLLELYEAKPVEVGHKAILITINQLYRSNMTPFELYEATRGIWRVGKRRENAEYAMSVYQGVVREVYRIHQWYPSGTLEYKTRDHSGFKGQKRWEFCGNIAHDIRDEYVGRFVGRGGQNPIRYVNV